MGIVGIERQAAAAPKLASIKALMAGDIKRAREKPIQYAEDDSFRADGQRQRENGSNGESGRFAQDAKSEAHILEQSFQEGASQGLVTFLAVALIAAEFDAGAAFRFGARKAGAF